MEALFFYSFGSLAIASALGVVFIQKPTRALLLLIVTMMALSTLYIKLGATFVAMINLIVYAGAILVLFLFVIMLQGVEAKDTPLRGRFSFGFIPGVLLVAGTFLLGLTHLISRFNTLSFQTVAGKAREIGRSLFTNYLLPFELVSILLILAIFAAVALAKREKDDA